MPTTTPSFPTFNYCCQICLWVKWSLTIEPLAWAPPVVRRTRERESDRNEKQRDGDRDREGERQIERTMGRTLSHICTHASHMYTYMQAHNHAMHTKHPYILIQCTNTHNAYPCTHMHAAHNSHLHTSHKCTHMHHTLHLCPHTHPCAHAHTHTHTHAQTSTIHICIPSHTKGTQYTHMLSFSGLCAHTCHPATKLPLWPPSPALCSAYSVVATCKPGSS